MRMPARTGTVGRAGRARAVQATASASTSRSRTIFTCRPPYLVGSSSNSVQAICALTGRDRALQARSSLARRSYLGLDLSVITRLVVVIGAVDPGDNADPPS